MHWDLSDYTLFICQKKALFLLKNDTALCPNQCVNLPTRNQHLHHARPCTGTGDPVRTLLKYDDQEKEVEINAVFGQNR